MRYKLTIFLILCQVSNISLADTKQDALDSNSLRLCGNALDACSDLTKAQGDQIEAMTEEIKALEANIVSKEDKASLPAWVWVGLGVVLGGVATKLILK